jgi:serine/threonine protein kinase
MIDFSRQACLLLQEAKGGALWTLHQPNGPLAFLDKDSASRVKYLAAVQIASAVSAMHNREWAHMDLHPAQVHVEISLAFGLQVSVKLLDFGGAHPLHTPASPSIVNIASIWGNCRYIWSMLVAGAPGVEETFRVTADPDCHALALTVFFVLTGIRPYSGIPDTFPNGTPSSDHIWDLRRQHRPAVHQEEIFNNAPTGSLAATLSHWEPVAKVISGSVIGEPYCGGYCANRPLPAETLLRALQECDSHGPH